MKVLHVINYYNDGLSYQENFLTHWQQRQDCEVKIVTSDYYFPFEDYQNTMYPRLGSRKRKIDITEDRGVQVIRKKSYFLSERLASLIWFRIYDVIKEFKPEVIHLHGATNLCLFELLFFKIFFKYKIFIDSHQDHMVEGKQNKKLKKLYYFPWKLIYSVCLYTKSVNAFLPITEDAMDWLLESLGIQKKHQIIN